MSNYGADREGCTCDAPHGSENRRCYYCRDQDRYEYSVPSAPKVKNRVKKVARKKILLDQKTADKRYDGWFYSDATLKEVFLEGVKYGRETSINAIKLEAKRGGHHLDYFIKAIRERNKK